MTQEGHFGAKWIGETSFSFFQAKKKANVNKNWRFLAQEDQRTPNLHRHPGENNFGAFSITSDKKKIAHRRR